MIPPVYIILTLAFTDLESRAKAFAIVSTCAGLGSAAGPLIGGLITSAISWRLSFILQILVVASIVIMGRHFSGANGVKRPFDSTGQFCRQLVWFSSCLASCRPEPMVG